MSHPLMADYYPIFKSMQETLSLFAEGNPQDMKKLKNFDQVKALWSRETAGISRATEKRLQKTRTILIQLYKKGHDCFFLCVLSISITTIGGIKNTNNFYTTLTWWMEKEAKISKLFEDYISQLYEEHKDFLTQSMVS
jgi:hypothetical protein